jgi:hypothetical protein
MKQYTDGYSMSVVSQQLIYEAMTPLTNVGFCLFNDLYAECGVLIADTLADYTYHTYVVRDGEQSEFFKPLLLTE